MPSENQMDWTTRLMSAGVGGMSALLALGASESSSRRESFFRVGFGTFVTFCTTGMVLDQLNIVPTVDAVLTAALVIGALAWYLFGAALIIMSQSSSRFVKWIVKKVTGIDLDALPERKVGP